MNTFQAIAVALLGVGCIYTIRAAVHRRFGPAVSIVWLVVWVAAAVAILEPEITVWAARQLGISRGADLVFYFAILGMIFGFFVISVRLRRLESEITTLVREIAMRDAPKSIGDESE